MRGFPIPPVSDPGARVRDRSAVGSRLSSLPDTIPGSRAAPASARIRRWQTEAPGSPLLLGEADGRHWGRGRQDPGLTSCPDTPASTDGRAIARGHGVSRQQSRAAAPALGACPHQPPRRGQEPEAACPPATPPHTSSLRSRDGAPTLHTPGSPPERPIGRHPTPPRSPLFIGAWLSPTGLRSLWLGAIR